jgi:nucleoside-diphosphate-sugar epimerase
VITGGAGSIGINFIELLLKNNPEKIVVIDNESSGNRKFLPANSRIDFRAVSICDKEALKTLLEETNPHYIFHLAAHFANQNSVDHPYADIETNIVGTLNLLEFSRSNPNLQKFVYASSSCVYGDSEEMKEEDYIYPYETPYAIDKYAAEMYTKYFAHLHGLPTVSVRIFNTYGPYELPGKYRNVIPNFIDRAFRNEPIIITGTGEETRDFTYAEDTARLLLLAAQSPVADGDFFNGGCGREITIKMLAEMIIRLCESKSEIIYRPRRTWDLVTKRVSDISKSRSVLGYNPEVEFEAGLAKTIQWHRGLDEK